MALKGMKIGFALTGSFCTLDKVMAEIEALKKQDAVIIPIMSEMVWNTDTRFGKAKDFIDSQMAL